MMTSSRLRTSLTRTPLPRRSAAAGRPPGVFRILSALIAKCAGDQRGRVRATQSLLSIEHYAKRERGGPEPRACAAYSSVSHGHDIIKRHIPDLREGVEVRTNARWDFHTLDDGH